MTASCQHKLNDWLEKSSAAGYNRLSRDAKTSVNKIWLGLLVCCYSVMVIHVSINLFKYLRFEANTVVKFDSTEVALPDITICRAGQTLEDYNRQPGATHTDHIFRNIFQVLEEAMDKMRFKSYFLARAEYFKNQSATRDHIANYLLRCELDGRKCDFQHFLLYRDPFFSNCFTFRPNISNHNIEKSGKFLSLLLFSQSERENVVNDQGFVVTIHERDTRPDIIHNYHEVEIGGTTKVGFKSRRVTLLSRPGARCLTDEYVKYFFTNRKEELRSFKYRKYDCYAEMLSKLVKEKCNCASPFVGVTEENKNRQSCYKLPYFNKEESKYMQYSIDISKSRNPTVNVSVSAYGTYSEKLKKYGEKFECHNRQMNKLMLDYHNLKCSEPCVRDKLNIWSNFRQYSVHNLRQIQEHLFPDIKGAKKMVKKLKKHGLYTELTKNELHRYARNQVRGFKLKDDELMKVGSSLSLVEIYVDSVPSDEVTETLSYPVESFLSDVGGNLGLWTGISIITLFELIELLVIVRNAKKWKQNARQENCTSELT